MRTYEIELTVQTVIKRTITSEKEETHGTLTEAAMVLEGLEGHTLVRSNIVDKTPKPPTDKERFNAAFKELRRLGYKARQNLSLYEDGPEVYTMREDAVDAFRGGELTGMMPLHWEYVNHENTVFHNQRVKNLTSVFEDHGFSVEWEGRFYNALQIRKGVEA